MIELRPRPVPQPTHRAPEPPDPKRRAWSVIGGAAIAFGLIILVAIVLSIVGLVAALAITDGPTATGEPVIASEPADPVPVETRSADEILAVTPADQLMAFVLAWETGDWDGAKAVATDDAVAVAQAWSEPGGRFDLGPEAATIHNRCFPARTAEGSCEMLYLIPDNPALLFTATVTATDAGPMVTSLVPAGDAG